MSDHGFIGAVAERGDRAGHWWRVLFGALRARRRLLAGVVGIVGLILAVRAVRGGGDELSGALEVLRRPRPGWVTVALGAEVLSYLAYGAAQRRLLATAGCRVGLGALTELAVATQALGNCLPAGYALGNVLSFRELRRRGVHAGLCARTLALTAGLYMAALAVLAVIGAELAGGGGAAQDVRLGAYLLFGVVALAVLVVWSLRRLGRLERVMTPLRRRLERLTSLRRSPSEALTSPASHPDATRVASKRAVLQAGGLLMAVWLADLGCLAAAFGAVGSTPPWQGLLLAYCAGQLAAVLPITPGGLGVVEGSLTFALVSYGGAQQTTLAAVLLYRLISYWGLLPTGALCYLALRRGTPRNPRLRGQVPKLAP